MPGAEGEGLVQDPVERVAPRAEVFHRLAAAADLALGQSQQLGHRGDVNTVRRHLRHRYTGPKCLD
ncbi:hypothetical protein ACQEWB_49435 [Streptomyces sp. CA-249302]|uniref:hypothetical protein n=1 Tax=Streptomyces sp. CA-249302 TaxID=3240058 RepID=UPI003D8CB009